MKVISIPKTNEFTQLDGKPFLKIKFDDEGKPVKKLGLDGNPMMARRNSSEDEYLVETERAGWLDELGLVFLNNLNGLISQKSKLSKDIKLLTDEDASYAHDVWRAIHAAHDTLELEKHPYEWLVRQLTAHGIDLFGFNVSVIKEPLLSAKDVEQTRHEKRRESSKA